MDYHTISTDPLAAMPVPAEMRPFRIPYLTANYLENKACQLLRQTWEANAEDFYIQFTHINILSECSLIASPARGNIAACLIYLLQGNISVREHESGKPLPRMEGDFYLRRVPTHDSSFILDFGQPGTYQMIYISISVKKLEALRQSKPLFQDRDILRSRDIRQAGTWIRSIIKEMQDRREPSKDALDRYLIRRTQRLLEAFIHLYDSSGIRWRELNPEERIDHLKVYIQNNMGANLRLSTLAKMLYMSEDSLRKMFQEVTGLPISRYIQKARINRACQLLETAPGKSMEQLAMEVGYSSLDGFYHAFEAQVGCPPKEYFRRKN